MNSATRLKKVLFSVNTSKEASGLKTYMRVFGVDHWSRVAYKLSMCDRQVDALETHNIDKEAIKLLRQFFTYSILASNMTVQKNSIPTCLMVLNSVEGMLPDEKVDDADITALAELVQSLEAMLEAANLPDEHVEIIQRYIEEMRDAFADLELGGVEAFEHHVITASGMVALYHDAFSEHSPIVETVNKIFKQSTAVISNASTWYGALGAGILLLGSK